MSGSPSKYFRQSNADQFVSGFSDPSRRVYFFIGRSYPWQDDTNPPAFSDSVAVSSYSIWNDILGMKLATSTDLSRCVARHDWRASQVFDQYDDLDTSLASKSYYVLTEDFNVYICLSNNSGATSTVKPAGTSTSIIETADGYRWKYLYTIGASDALKFLSINSIPVKTLPSNDGSAQWAVQAAAVSGSIDQAFVTNGGSGYVSRTATAQAGGASSITLDTGASAVNSTYNGYSVYISSGTGAGQLRTISAYNGTTKVATVGSAWSTNPDNSSVFVVSPSIIASGDGSGWTGYTEVTSGQISKVRTLTSGSNYSRITLTVGGNTGSGATVRGVLPPVGGHGADPVDALNGYWVMLNSRLSGSESGTLPVTNEYRTLGLILNPRLTANNAIAGATNYDMTTKLAITGISGTFAADETIVGGTSGQSAVIVSANSSQISVISSTGSFTNSETLTGQTSNAHATLSSSTAPAIKKRTGRIMYAEYRTPVPRSANQLEDLKTVIKFSLAVLSAYPLGMAVLNSIACWST